MLRVPSTVCPKRVTPEQSFPEIPLCRAQTGYYYFPYPPDYADGRTNNGGIDLLREPYRIDEITELKSLPNFRSILLRLNGPDSEFMTLGFEAGAQDAFFDGYLEFAFRDSRFAEEGNYRDLLRCFSHWTLQRYPQLAPYLPSCLRGEIQEFSYRDRWHGDRMTLWFRAANETAADELLQFLAACLIDEISPQLSAFRVAAVGNDNGEAA